jgi:hypothetical protein
VGHSPTLEGQSDFKEEETLSSTKLPSKDGQTWWGRENINASWAV